MGAVSIVREFFLIERAETDEIPILNFSCIIKFALKQMDL